MNKIFITYLLLILTIPATAQDNSESEKRALEREIKVSGLYIYAEAVGKDKAEATKMAKTMLVSEINKEILNHPEWQFAKTINVDDVEYQSDLIDLARGNRTRVVAYLKKENIQAVFADNVPKIKLTDKKEEKKEKEEKKSEKTADKNTAVTDTVITEITKEEVEEGLKKESPSLIQSLIEINSATAINKVLRDNKMKGKAVYGGANTLTDSNKAYILVYNSSGEVLALFDKGEGAERLDLRSNETRNMRELFKGNLYTWFQLF